MRIDGLLIVDKPEGITSLDVVREIKRRFSVKKAGHLGTLDPFATGVLPVMLNEGTKLAPFLEEEPKEYEGVLLFGEETATDDGTGEVVNRGPWQDLTEDMIRDAFRAFLGALDQIPPMFSAVKVQGEPLYRMARKGMDVERKGRKVHIFDLHIESLQLPQIYFRVLCSKGTYIRALGRDIGRTLGCGAHLRHLRRIRSGAFSLQGAMTWRDVKEFKHVDDLRPWVISPIEALGKLPEVKGDDHLVRKVRFGREMVVRDLCSQVLPSFEKGQWVKITSSGEELVAILRSEIKGGDIQKMHPEVVALRPLRVFHTQENSRREGHV